MPYPFWEKNRADRASSDAAKANREANQYRNRLETIEAEIEQYKSLNSDAHTKEELIGFLDRISKILSK
jgi:hypothetical protein